MVINSFVNLVKSLNIPNVQVAEIGVREGYSTRAYIEHIKSMNGHLYAVDWFKQQPDRDGRCVPPENEFRQQENLLQFKAHLVDYLDHMTILVGRTIDEIPKIPNRSLDLCFIDADHSYFACMCDIELCLSKVKIGGILCGHDCGSRGSPNKYSAKQLYRNREIDRGHVGVEQAVHDWFGDNYELCPDSV